MDKLDQLFKENRDDFDHREPRKELWDSIQLPSRKRHQWLKIAATILIIVGISGFGYVIFQNIQAPQKPAQTSEQPDQLVQTIQQLELKAPNGDKVVLIPASNKFTLVQFWASTDKICTEQSCYYFKPVYEKYKDKGFEIYAVSLDEDLKTWTDNIEKHDLNWIHVSDLKGFDSPVCAECNIAEIPSTFLIDHKGTIIARNIDAQDLDAKLAVLYKGQ